LPSAVVASKPNIVTLTSRQIYVNIKIPSKSVSALVLNQRQLQLLLNPYTILSNTFLNYLTRYMPEVESVLKAENKISFINSLLKLVQPVGNYNVVVVKTTTQTHHIKKNK
jgi:hypothetical protein